MSPQFLIQEHSKKHQSGDKKLFLFIIRDTNFLGTITPEIHSNLQRVNLDTNQLSTPRNSYGIWMSGFVFHNSFISK